MEEWKIWSEVIHNLAVASAVIVGGIWVLYTFVFQRSHETALKIEMTTADAPYDEGRLLVFFEVVLINLSRRMLAAQPKTYNGGTAEPVYRDSIEELTHACSLQVRRIKSGAPPNSALDWFDSVDYLEPVGKEINVVGDWEISRTGAADCWMEPGESYYLGVTMVLPPGRYLAMVTFVGADLPWYVRRGDQFWRRLFFVQLLASEFNGSGERPAHLAAGNG